MEHQLAQVGVTHPVESTGRTFIVTKAPSDLEKERDAWRELAHALRHRAEIAAAGLMNEEAKESIERRIAKAMAATKDLDQGPRSTWTAFGSAEPK